MAGIKRNSVTKPSPAKTIVKKSNQKKAHVKQKNGIPAIPFNFKDLALARVDPKTLAIKETYPIDVRDDCLEFAKAQDGTMEVRMTIGAAFVAKVDLNGKRYYNKHFKFVIMDDAAPNGYRVFMELDK